MITSIQELNREIHNRCGKLGLTIDCGADGLFGAEIAIVGEAPGEREKSLKRPLVGGSGKYLWDMLRPYGINRTQVYISNVVKKQLAHDLAGKETISRNEVDQYAQILRWELENLPNLKYVVCLGNYALEAVAGISGITNCRGSVYDVQLSNAATGIQSEVRVIALLNPAHVMRQPQWEVMFKFDIARVDRVIKGDYVGYDIEALINPSFREASSYIERMQDERLPVSVDIETIAGETACIGFANDAHSGMCISFRDRTRNVFSLSEECDLNRQIQRLVENPDVRLVGQNIMFDTYWLWLKDRIRLGPAFFDTMLAHHTLYPSLPHNLGFLTSQYTEHPFYKDEGKEWREGGSIDTFWQYNVKDVCITLKSQQKMLKELQAQNLEKFFFDHVMRLQPHLIRMTTMGIMCDTSMKDQIAESMQQEVLGLRTKFQSQVLEALDEVGYEYDPGYKPNPASPKQMAELYFRKLRLVGRGVSTDEKNRARMLHHPRTPGKAVDMIITLNTWAKEAKFAGTYAESKVSEDGRFRCEYKQIGVKAAPGRLSSAALLDGTGGNLQNQPERAHVMYVADHGYMFSYFDLSQAEARVVGWKAKISKWIEDFERARLQGNFDCHRSLAAEMWHIPYEDVPSEDRLPDGTVTKRFIAKRCRHGLNYRMGPDRLAETTGLSMRDAEDAYRIYHRINPELQAWWDETVKEAKTNRKLFNAYGRRWVLLERADDEALKSIVAFYPQSTIGDKVCRVIYQCEEHRDWPPDARIILNIHDALVAIHRPCDGDTVRSIMKLYAEEPLNIDGKELIIPADFKVSVPDDEGIHRWSTIKKKVYPNVWQENGQYA